LSGNNVTASSNDGIVLSSASNNTLFGNNVTANSNIGILLESSYNCTLSGNNVANNGYGIKLYSASGDTLSGNNVVKNGNGIELYSSSDNMIYHNDFINNTSQVSSSNSTNIWDSGGLGNYWSDYLTKYPNATKVDGFGVWNTSYVIDANNTDYYPLMQLWVPYEGGPITINADGSISPSTAPITTVDNITYTFTANIIIESIVVQRDNIVLNGAGFTIQGDGTGNGIDLSNRNNITIENTNIENFQYGTFLENTSNNTISENNITANTYDGIYLYSSSNNSLNANNITGNNILGNSTGIVLESSSNNNNVSGNSLTSNRVGILFDSSSNNRLSGNNITNNFDGMYLYSSANNNLNGNNIAANTYDGIYLDSSSNNTIYHNNFINNTSQVSSSNSTNIWDSGGLGNYWSDYLTKYPNATETDGVWNTPYVIDTHNTDHYPLTVPIVVVPEFPWIQATMLFMLLTLLAAIIYKKKAVKTSQS
jgi:parallel beta-helix repeat protein